MQRVPLLTSPPSYITALPISSTTVEDISNAGMVGGFTPGRLHRLWLQIRYVFRLRLETGVDSSVHATSKTVGTITSEPCTGIC